MAPNTMLLLCLSLALISLVHAFPFDIEDGFEQNVDAANLVDGDGDFDEEPLEPMPVVSGGENAWDGDGEGELDGLSAQDKLLAFYERERRGARWHKNFSNVSSLDRSITAYTSFLPCRVESVCKQKFKQTFRCKCNRHTYCVGPGKKYEARCRYSAVGHVFYQP